MSATNSSKRPRSRRTQARVMRAVNAPMRLVLALPFPTPLTKRLMLLFLTGRRTGRSYRQPVSYVPYEGALLTPGGGKWTLNLVEGQPVRVRLRGHDVEARPEIISDLDEVERLLGVITDANPTAGRFVGISKGPDGRLDRERLAVAVQYGFRIIRWFVDS